MVPSFAIYGLAGICTAKWRVFFTVFGVTSKSVASSPYKGYDTRSGLTNNELSVYAPLGVETESVIIGDGPLRRFGGRIHYQRKNIFSCTSSKIAFVCLFLCHGSSSIVG
jgi:hypothetical protein